MRSEGYCSWVCLSVCLLSHISPMERLFVLKTLSRTQRATKVKKFVGFSLKPLRCRDPALPPLYGHAYSRPFFHACTRMRISRVYTRMIHRRGFSTLVLSFTQQKRDGCYDNSIWLFQLHVLLLVRRLLCKIDMYASTFISHITFSYDVYALLVCDSIVIIIDVHPTRIPL